MAVAGCLTYQANTQISCHILQIFTAYQASDHTSNTKEYSTAEATMCHT